MTKIHDTDLENMEMMAKDGIARCDFTLLLVAEVRRLKFERRASAAINDLPEVIEMEVSAEREACAKIVETYTALASTKGKKILTMAADAIRGQGPAREKQMSTARDLGFVSLSALHAEREACAAIAEDNLACPIEGAEHSCGCHRKIAAAIRARGGK